ncbi:VOC family protein [Chitinimonas sp.]|uniref:VOC family protein n=1 Tax=Chitinimonas sp. TaxID=1934313 RepID=UPI002F93A03C
MIQPYLFYSGRCEEAIEFYRKALGAEVLMMMRMKESPDGIPPHIPAGSENKIMHASLQIGGGVLMLSDGMCSGEPKFEGFSLSISPATVAEAERRFAALSEGGKVTMPLDKTFWSPCFGMLTDRFGVNWMVNVVQPA